MSDAAVGGDSGAREPSAGHGRGRRIAALVIAVAIVCVAAIAVMVTLPPQSPSEFPCERSETLPIEFGSVTKGGTPPFNNSASWDVTCISRHLDPAASFRVRITRSTDVTWPAPQPLVFGAIVNLDQTVMAIITDADGNGKLSVGDTFLVYGMEDHYYWGFYVVSAQDPEMLGAANWDTKSALPSIAFSLPTYGGSPQVNTTVSWTVTSTAGRTYSFSRYEAKIMKDGVSLTLSPRTLSAGTPLIFGSFDYEVKLMVRDLAADGNLTVGDEFFVYQLPPNHSWNFTLYWFVDAVKLDWIEWTTSQLPRPVVKFSAVSEDRISPSNNTANWTVAEVSGPAYLLDSYNVIIKMDGGSLMPFGLNLTSGYAMEFGASVRMIFGDLGGDDALTVGDTFLVYGMDEPHLWNASLLWWHDGTVIAWAEWATDAPKPMVTFSGPMQGGSGTNLTARLTVSSTSSSCIFSLFEVLIEMDAVPVGPAAGLAAGTVITLGGTVNLIVTDMNLDGKLTAGDMLFVYGMSGAHLWRFHLLWAPDGSDVQIVTWNT